MANFFKGIFVGIGGIAPGLSGSILLVIFGLYTQMIEAMGNFFKNVKKNCLFLVPLFLGFGVGVLIFGKVVDYLITNFEIYTRYAFLGLILGTIPLFYKEVTEKRFFKQILYSNVNIIFYGNSIIFAKQKFGSGFRKS